MDGLELKIILFLLNQEGQSATLSQIQQASGADVSEETISAALAMMTESDPDFNLIGDKYVLVGANVTSPIAKAALAETLKMQEAVSQRDTFLEEIQTTVQDSHQFSDHHALAVDFSKLAVWNADGSVEKGLASDAALTLDIVMRASKKLLEANPAPVLPSEAAPNGLEGALTR